MINQELSKSIEIFKEYKIIDKRHTILDTQHIVYKFPNNLEF